METFYRDVERESAFGYGSEERAKGFNDGVDKVILRVDQYAERLAALRCGAGDAQRGCYTVALGQLYALGLIEEETWREAVNRPRQELPKRGPNTRRAWGAPDGLP